MKQLFMRFKEKPEHERRSASTLIRWRKDELQNAKRSAEMRCLPLAEFVRRAALGRKADVRYEEKIVLELRDVAATMREFHKIFLTYDMEPPEEMKAAFRLVIQQAVEAMLRISK